MRNETHRYLKSSIGGGVARTLTARRYKEWIKSYFRKDGFSSTAVLEIIYEE